MERNKTRERVQSFSNRSKVQACTFCGKPESAAFKNGYVCEDCRSYVRTHLG